MPAVRLEAMRALAAAIAAVVPGLEIQTGQPIGRKLCFPSLAIHPTSFRYTPEQEMDYGTPDPDETDVVVQVGSHEATVQLRLYTATPGER
jgi:hypothetical protein